MGQAVFARRKSFPAPASHSRVGARSVAPGTSTAKERENTVTEKNGLADIESRAGGVLNSPYLFRELPEELQNLRALLRSVDRLTRQDIPFLISEIKQLRAENKRLEAEIAALRAPQEVEVEA
jgi:ABC-type phosphate transport system auxiliary subunit